MSCHRTVAFDQLERRVDRDRLRTCAFKCRSDFRPIFLQALSIVDALNKSDKKRTHHGSFQSPSPTDPIASNPRSRHLAAPNGVGRHREGNFPLPGLTPAKTIGESVVDPLETFATGSFR